MISMILYDFGLELPCLWAAERYWEQILVPLDTPEHVWDRNLEHGALTEAGRTSRLLELGRARQIFSLFSVALAYLIFFQPLSSTASNMADGV